MSAAINSLIVQFAAFLQINSAWSYCVSVPLFVQLLLAAQPLALCSALLFSLLLGLFAVLFVLLLLMITFSFHAPACVLSLVLTQSISSFQPGNHNFVYHHSLHCQVNLDKINSFSTASCKDVINYAFVTVKLP